MVFLKQITCLVILLWISPVYGFNQISFDDSFTDRSLRVDFVIAGNHLSSDIYLDEIRREPHFGGPRNQLLDPFDYGEYKFEIISEASGELIFSRGVCTLFEEWQTTSQAKSVRRAYDQVIVFPEPLQPFVLKIFERDEENVFQTKLSLNINPADPYIKEGLTPEFPFKQIVKMGAPSEKLDIVFLAEGYTAAESEKFYKDVVRFSNKLLSEEPYHTLKSSVNVWAVASVSKESGTDLPEQSIWKNTVMNSNFYTFGSDRYLTTDDIKSVRNIAGIVPYDVICILVNTNKYGGGGIYNHYAMVSSDGLFSEIVLIHELGHAFAGLSDEYYNSPVAYEEYFDPELEPWQPNLTTLVKFDSKWKDLMDESVPVPTPATEEYRDVTGVFEGGGYSARGIYRPAYDCRMKSNEADKFCEVCSRSIEQMVQYYTGRLIK